MSDLIFLRASSLSELFDCPARWEAKNIQHFFLPTGGAARLGTAVHAGTALFDQSRIDGNPLTEDECAGAVVDAIWDKTQEDVDWSEQPQQEAENIAISLHKLYCSEIAPKQEYVAVEARCTRLEIANLGICLTGTTDRIRRTADGRLAIADLKTGKTAVSADGTVKTVGHSAQLAVYRLLAMQCFGDVVAEAQIIGLQVAKTEKGRRVGIGNTTAPLELLLGDELTGEKGLLQIASVIFKTGNFYGNPRSSLCSEKFCPIFAGCRWR